MLGRLERSRERHADILERLGEERDRGRVRSERSPAEKPCISVQGDPTYLGLLDELRELHLEKSAGYGTGDDPFANFTAVAGAKNQPRWEYAVDRDQEKTTRLYSLMAQGRVDDLEQEFLDKAGLMLCAAAMLREDIGK
jgi:hypothetical protein